MRWNVLDKRHVCTKPRRPPMTNAHEEAQWPIGYGVELRIKRSSAQIRPWPLRWVLGQGSLLPLAQEEAFTLASITYLAVLVKYILTRPSGWHRNGFHKYTQASLKGSVERSLLPWAIFLIFTRNRPWKTEDHLCTLFFIEMSKERLEKSERTPTVSWRPWALAYSRDRPYNFSCLSAVSKNRRFRCFFLCFGVSFGEEKPFVTSNASF